LPDAETLSSAKSYGGRTRQLFMRRRAREACAAYTQWLNGDIYGYEIQWMSCCPACCHEESQTVTSCWGFYGLDNCRDEAAAVVQQLTSTVMRSDTP
jgi:hypothetical protein